MQDKKNNDAIYSLPSQVTIKC